MPDDIRNTIICTAEREPSGFHPSDTIGYSVRLSFETTATAEHDDAHPQHNWFFGNLENVSFGLYCLGSFSLKENLKQEPNPEKNPEQKENLKQEELVSCPFLVWIPPYPQPFKQGTSDRFKTWLYDLHQRDFQQHDPQQSGFFTTNRPDESQTEEEISAGDVGAPHLIHGAGTWTAPLPQEIGLTHLLRLREKELVRFACDELIIIPFFKGVAPDTANANLTKFSDGSLEYRYGADSLYCRTRAVAQLPEDDSSLLDYATGFLRPGAKEEVYRALKHFEERAGSLLWALPALLSEPQQEKPPLEERVKATDTGTHEDARVLYRLIWKAMNALQAALDPVQIALLMPARDDRQGPLLAPLVEMLETRLAEKGMRSVTTRAILNALKGSLSQCDVFKNSENELKEHTEALARQFGFNIAESEPTTGLPKLSGSFLEILLGLGVGLDTPSAIDWTDELYKTFLTELKIRLFSAEELDSASSKLGQDKVAFVDLEKEAGYSLEARLTEDLSAFSALVQGEDGVERIVLNLLDAGIADRSGAKVGWQPIDEEFAEYFPADNQKAAQEACKEARAQYRQRLASNFNGAEAVRQACGTCFGDLLLEAVHSAIKTTGPEGIDWQDLEVSKLQKVLSDSNFFIERFAPQPANTPFQRITAKLPKLASGFINAPDGHLTDDLLSESLITSFQRAVEELFPSEVRRLIPDSTPSPLPLQITADSDTLDLDSFGNLFNGLGVLIRTDDQKVWSYANLAELSIKSENSAITGYFVHPLQTVEIDGRRQVFLEYHGLPFTTAAFHSTPGVADRHWVEPFYGIDYPLLTDSEYARLPPLAYGKGYQVLAFAVTRAGTLPAALQEDPFPPFLPRAKPDLATYDPTIFDYSRRTAIGTTAIVEGTEKRIGVAVEGVYPLFQDYPRVGMSASPGKDGFLDVFRSADGTGNVDLPNDFNPRASVSLNDIWWWGESGTLVISLHEDPTADVDSEGLADSEGLPVAFSWPVTSQTSGTLTFEFAVEKGQVEVKAAFNHADEQLMKFVSKRASLWLRLRLKTKTASPASAASISLAVPKANASGAAAMSKSAPDNLLLLAPDVKNVWSDALKDSRDLLVSNPTRPDVKNVWSDALKASLQANITFPRVGFADLDRWLSNFNLHQLETDQYTNFLSTLFAARTWCDANSTNSNARTAPQQEVGDLLNKLPDLAVRGLLVELTPLDGLYNCPHDLMSELTARSAILEIADLATMLDKISANDAFDNIATLFNAHQNQPNSDTASKIDQHLYNLLRSLDQAYSVPLEVHCGEQLVLEVDKPKISVTVPAGTVTQLTIRPLVLTKRFNDGKPPVFDSRMKELAQGTCTYEGEICYLFGGASLIIESALGAVKTKTIDPTKPWQVVVDGDKNENEWERLVDSLVNHQPLGWSRAYDLVVDKIVPGDSEADNDWKFRQVGTIDVHTQRWRFTGRPIYSWFDPNPQKKDLAEDEGSLAGGQASVVVQRDRPDLHQFENEAFFDRDDLDAAVRTIRLEPYPSSTTLAHIEWEEPSATLFRHRFSVRSRYAGAISNPAEAVASAWTNEASRAWLRVALLAERSKIQLTRPQLRALLPLTSSLSPNLEGDPAQGEGASSPPIVAILQERPFGFGGLAERIAPEIKLGVGYEVRNGKTATSEESEAKGISDTTPVVEPADLRKEIGPDPRLSYQSLKPDLAAVLTLVPEGPIGLTLDTTTAATPAFINTLCICHLMMLKQDGNLVGGRLEEHFVSLGLRRYLDPRWVVKNAETTQSAGTSLWCEFKGCGDFTAGERIFWVVQEADATKGYLDPKAIDSTVSTDAAANSLEVFTLAGVGHDFALLHVPLEDGRASLSVFYLPRINSPLSPDQSDWLGNIPIVLASFEWVMGQGNRTMPDFPEGKLWPTSASSVTMTNWTRTNKDFDHVFVRPKGETAAAVRRTRCADLKLRKQNGSIAINCVVDAEAKDVWIMPEQWLKPYPLNTQRHIAMVFSERSSGLGRPLDIYNGARRSIGGTVEPTGIAANLVRLVEFETPAVIIGYLPTLQVPEPYEQGYFDLVAIGFDSSDQSRTLSFFMRLVASSNVTNNLESLTLELSGTDGGAPKFTMSVNVPPNDKVVLGFYLTLKLDDANSNPSYRVAYTDGSVSASSSIDLLSPGKVGQLRGRQKVRSDVAKVVEHTQGSVGTASSIRSSTGFYLELSNLTCNGKMGEDEGWLEISMLASRAKPGPQQDDGLETDEVDFDWFFTGVDQPLDRALSERELHKMTEVQARIVAVSPALELS